jgi:hypothetical protein
MNTNPCEHCGGTGLVLNRTYGQVKCHVCKGSGQAPTEAWTCDKCGQLNSDWDTTCGRCETPQSPIQQEKPMLFIGTLQPNSDISTEDFIISNTANKQLFYLLSDEEVTASNAIDRLHNGNANPVPEPTQELEELVPSWSKVSLTKQGYIKQRIDTLEAIQALISQATKAARIDELIQAGFGRDDTGYFDYIDLTSEEVEEYYKSRLASLTKEDKED